MLPALILYMSGGTYNLKATLNDRFLRNFFKTFFLFTHKAFVKNLLRGCSRSNVFSFCRRCMTCGLNCGLTTYINYINTTKTTATKTLFVRKRNTNLKYRPLLRKQFHEILQTIAKVIIIERRVTVV